MIQGRKIAIAVLVAFAATGMVYADMMPLVETHHPTTSAWNSCDCTDFGPLAAFDPFSESDTGRSDFLPFASFAGLHMGAESVDSTGPAVQVLSHDPSSFDLCLYALVGLGLCRSGHWAKKSALGFVPQWYHSGAPEQIGHSYVVGPDTLCPIPLYCFIQPDGMSGDSLLPCRTEAFTSLRHPSQHTPARLVSRGPPLA